jgi:SAM-dependent methyltransferase
MELRATFNEAAELYDRIRPGYPGGVFQDLAGYQAGQRILEIGCGTGKATVPLAERGYQVVAVELGDDMARVARRQLAGFDRVEVVTADFETWPLPAEPFDVVFSATAFHWIDPAVRMRRAAAALRPGGVLAIVSTEHILGGTVPFFVAVQDCYERFDPATPSGLRQVAADEIPRDERELAGYFGPATFHRYEWEQAYSAAEYRDLLLTYSGHRALPAADQAGLLACIGEQHRLHQNHSGQIGKRYLTQLMLATKL